MNSVEKIAALEGMLARVQRKRSTIGARLALPFELLTKAPRQERARDPIGPEPVVDLGPSHEVGGAALRRAEPPVSRDEGDEGGDADHVDTKPQLPMLEPVASVSEPVASEPVASEPVASEPVASEPVASEQVVETSRSQSEPQYEPEPQPEPEPQHEPELQREPAPQREPEPAPDTKDMLGVPRTPTGEVTKPLELVALAPAEVVDSADDEAAADEAPEISVGAAQDVLDVDDDELLAAESEVDEQTPGPAAEPETQRSDAEIRVSADDVELIDEPTPHVETEAATDSDAVAESAAIEDELSSTPATPMVVAQDEPPSSTEVVTQPQPVLEVSQPIPLSLAHASTREPVTQPRPDVKLAPPPLPRAQLPSEDIVDPQTDVSTVSDMPPHTAPHVEVETAPDPDGETAKLPKKEIAAPRSVPPPLPPDPSAPAGRTQISLDAPPSPTPAPVIQAAAEVGQRVIGPVVVKPPPLEASAVGEFIGELEQRQPATFGEVIEATLSLEL
jgi:hypothetical protein